MTDHPLGQESSGSLESAAFIVLGKVVDATGLRGAVKVHPFADDPAAWSRMKSWWVGSDGEAPETWRKMKLIHCRVQPSGTLVASFDGIADRNASEALRGLLVGAPREVLPETADDEYYWSDLIGLDVVNARDQSLGKVLGLIETSANDVLRVGDGENEERLLPFVAAVVLDVDLATRTMRVDWEADW